MLVALPVPFAFTLAHLPGFDNSWPGPREATLGRAG
jgi:hypothetical protein